MTTKQIIIEVQSKNNRTQVFGTGNHWTDMAIVLEGLGVVCQACVNEGRKPEEVYGEVQEYFNKIGVVGYKVYSKQI